MEILCAKDLTFTYAGEKAPVLHSCSFCVESGEFVLLYGASGSGKTTLLRLLKPEIAPKGTRKGALHFCEKPIAELPYAQSVKEIAFTAQNPDTQQVSEYVRNELRFLPENLGLSEAEIRLKVAETVSFFGAQDLYNRKIQTLSGGEKQLVNLMAAFVCSPRLLLLDEPFSMLDPFSGERFLRALLKLHTDLGVTVLLTEHNIQPILPFLTKVLVLEQGVCKSYDSADVFLRAHPTAAPSVSIPAAAGVPIADAVPKTLGQCRNLVQAYNVSPHLPEQTEILRGTPLLTLRRAAFRYARGGEDVLRDVDFTLCRGDSFAVIGANGAGKTTFLKLLSGELSPYSGKAKYAEELRVAVVPQNPQTCFAFDTVGEILNTSAIPPTAKTLFKRFNGTPNPAPQNARVQEIAEALGLLEFLPRNPFDLSAGQQQRVAIAAALLKEPDVLLFDEPTKGLDPVCKQSLCALLRDLRKAGKTVLFVTHDLDFAAEIATRCALLFDGEFVLQAASRAFFTGGTVYTSSTAQVFCDTEPARRPVSLSEVQNGEA